DWQVGQTVVAIGKTFEAEQPNLSVGILSALDRVWGKAIQTDAKISPANYGGPLIDLHGRHLGVLVPLSPDSDGELAGAEWYDSGIGFAVPLEDIMRQLPRWSTGEDLQPGKLGVSLKDPEDLDPEPVVGVVKLKSPAAEAGIRAGDRIVSVDGRATDRLSQMRHALTPRYAGDQVALVIRRDDEELNLNVTLVAKVPPYEHPFLGIIPDRQTGGDKAMVEFCYPESPAELAGLKPGDQITHWNEQAIDSVAALRLAIANVEPGATVTVAWQREAEPISAQVKLAALPRTILATAPTHKDGEERPDFEVGELEVSVPEVPHAYKAYVPASMQKGHVPGLVVLLPPPGEGKSEDLITAWKPVCEARDLVLLVAKPADDTRWTSREVDTVRKFIDQAKTRFGIDEQRIGLVGDGAGGAMAYLLTIRNRELIRGLAIRDAASPVPIEAFENEPLTRLAFLFLTHASLDNNSEMEKEMNELVAAKFPVTQRSLEDDSHKLVASDIEAIGLWLDCLDRL
ncbi:MAG: PDZ domain-containing protein, partial [Planctomycetales bacterium]|nr:PDZ domain-containing protein [Planctomycetales bacterium]